MKLTRIVYSIYVSDGDDAPWFKVSDGVLPDEVTDVVDKYKALGWKYFNYTTRAIEAKK